MLTKRRISFLLGVVLITFSAVCSAQEEICQRYRTRPGCNRQYRPVCSNNGLTYDNECVFCNAANTTMKIEYPGPCRAAGGAGKSRLSMPIVPAKDFKPCPSGQPSGCSRIYSPVCGSDRITYTNQCMLCYLSAKNGVTVKRGGPC